MIESETSSFLGVLVQDMTEKSTCYFNHFESDRNGFADFLTPSAYIYSRQHKTNHILMLTATVNISIYYRFDTGFVKYRCWGFFKMFPPEKFPPFQCWLIIYSPFYVYKENVNPWE